MTFQILPAILSATSRLDLVPELSNWKSKVDTFWADKDNEIQIFIDRDDYFPDDWATIIFETQENGYKGSRFKTIPDAINEVFHFFINCYDGYLFHEVNSLWENEFKHKVPEELAEEVFEYFRDNATINYEDAFLELAERCDFTVRAQVENKFHNLELALSGNHNYEKAKRCLMKLLGYTEDDVDTLEGNSFGYCANFVVLDTEFDMRGFIEYQWVRDSTPMKKPIQIIIDKTSTIGFLNPRVGSGPMDVPDFKRETPLVLSVNLIVDDKHSYGYCSVFGKPDTNPFKFFKRV